MMTTMRTLVGSTVGGLVLVAAAAGLVGGPLNAVHGATGAQQAHSVGYHLGNQMATGGGGIGIGTTGGGGVGMGATGGGGAGSTTSG